MPKQSPNKADSKSDNGAIRARIVDGAGKHSYEMFEAHDVTLKGAFLEGQLFLEVDEEFMVEFGFGEHNVRVNAKVIGIERDDKVGMKIEFPALTTRERRKLEARLGGDS